MTILIQLVTMWLLSFLCFFIGETRALPYEKYMDPRAVGEYSKNNGISNLRGGEKCLDYDSTVDSSVSPRYFDYKKYEGIWYVASTNEPTEPSFCKCDSFNWTISSLDPAKFNDPTTFTCAGFTTTMGIEGTLSTDPEVMFRTLFSFNTRS